VSLQHFVPRFVLRHFSTPGKDAGKRQRIVAYDLKVRKSFQASLMKVGASHDFYEFVTGTGLNLSIDPFLTDIEHVTAPVWRKLAESQRLDALDAHEREGLALFIITLSARGPATRATIEGMPSMVLEALRRRGEDTKKMEQWFGARSKEQDADIHASSIVYVAQHYKRIAARTWILFRPPAGKRFCTSDSPVTQFNEFHYGPGGNLGLLTRGICLQIAITPVLMLLIVDGEAYGLREVDQVFDSTADNLLHYNALLARFAHRYLYASSSLDFEIPEGQWIPDPMYVIE
jgi:hypothetical protein